MRALAAVFEDLRYQQYALQRSSAPSITPASWKHVFGTDVDQWEVRYQAERAITKARVDAELDSRGL